MDGWLKLFRKILNWEWYDDGNTFRLFLHLLLIANIEDKNWRGAKIMRGQTFTSVKNLGKELKLSSKQIRNSLSKLKNSGEICITGANNGTMITICKYDEYQQKQKQKGKQTDKRGANEGQQLKKDKKKKKYIDTEQILKFNSWLDKNAPRVLDMEIQMNDEELTKLKSKYSLDKITDIFIRMHNWKKLYQNTDVYLTAMNWLRLDDKKEQEGRI